MQTAASVYRAAGVKGIDINRMKMSFATKDPGKGGVLPTKEQYARWEKVIHQDRIRKGQWQ